MSFTRTDILRLCQKQKVWAMDLLNRKKIKFTEYNITSDSKKREEMLKRSNGTKTIPQIFIDDYHVGGNDKLQALEREGKLDNLLKS